MSKGTRDAQFEQFAAARSAQLFRSAYLLCGERHGAEDLVQETLAKVYVKWGRQIDNPAAYAQTTLVRTYISQQRRRSSQEVPYADLPDSATADPTENTGLRLALQDLLDDLAPLDRADPADDVRQVAVSADEMGSTLAGLLPAATALEDDQPYQFQVQRGVVQWRGVKVTLAIDSRGVGTSTTARARCETFMSQPCSKAPDGGWLARFGTVYDVNAPGEVYHDVVRLYEPDGYVIEATGERGPAQSVDEGGGSDADPAVLRRLVLDDVWLRSGSHG